MKKLKSYFTKEEWSWIFYDWASSAYSLIIVTAILPLYFKYSASTAGITGEVSTAYWGYASSIASIVISLVAPILGTIGDNEGYKKKCFTFFAIAGCVFSATLSFIPEQSWLAILIVFVLSYISFQGSNVFYDGFLVDVSSEEKMDTVSSSGYGFGYFGSCLIFIVVMVLQLTDGFGLLGGTTVIKISFFLTALWWFLFTLPFFKNVKQRYFAPKVQHPIRESFSRLSNTLKEIKKYRGIGLFLIAYFFYIDGVDTIFTMATAIGADFGIDTNKLIVMLLMLNFIAFPFTILYGMLANKFGTRTMILVAISVYTFISIFALFIQNETQFWILGVLVGTSQGGIQALSRSYFASIVPKEKSNEFFGFYNIFGKFSAILGPTIVGFVGQMTGKSQWGISALVVLFIVGGVMLARNQQQMHREVKL